MWDSAHKMAQLLRHFLAISLGNYGALIASFLINLVLTWRLGVEKFGRLALFLMVSQVLLMLISNWTLVGLIRNASQEFATEGSVSRTFWARSAIASPLVGIAGIALMAGRKPLAAYLEVPEWALALLFGHFLLTFALVTLGAVMQACQDMNRYSMTMFAEKFLSLIMVTVLPTSVLTDPLAVVVCYVVSVLVVSLWGVAVVGWRTFQPVRFDAGTSRALLRFSLPFVLTSWVGLFATNWVDFVLLKWSRSVSEVGLYALAGQLAGVIQQVTITFSTLLLPHFSVLVGTADEYKIRMFLDRILPYWFFAISVLFGMALLVVLPLVPLIFGEAFAGALPALEILIVASSALALYNAFDPLLSAYGATVSLAKVFLLSVSVKVILSWLLVPQWGISGAAFSTVCTYTVCALFTMFLVQRKTRSQVMMLALFGTPVALACGSILYLPEKYASLIALIGGATCLYAVSRRFQLFKIQDRQLLKSIWKAALQGNVVRALNDSDKP